MKNGPSRRAAAAHREGRARHAGPHRRLPGAAAPARENGVQLRGEARELGRVVCAVPREERVHLRLGVLVLLLLHSRRALHLRQRLTLCRVPVGRELHREVFGVAALVVELLVVLVLLRVRDGGLRRREHGGLRLEALRADREVLANTVAPRRVLRVALPKVAPLRVEARGRVRRQALHRVLLLPASHALQLYAWEVILEHLVILRHRNLSHVIFRPLLPLRARALHQRAVVLLLRLGTVR